MAISAGAYTVGGTATDYPGVTGLDDAIADTIGLTGALTYVVSGDVDWTTDISLTQNGYPLTITSDTWHEGKISEGWYVTMDNNKAIAPAGANKVVVEKVKIRTIGTKIISIGNAAQPHYEFDKCIFNGITVQFARPSAANESKFTNNLFYESLIDILGSQAVDNYITIENNFFYATQKCVTFRVWNTQPDYTSTILRNNYFVREIGDDAIHHTGTILVYPSGYNNASKGTSVGTFPWNDSSKNKPSIDPAKNIQSLDITSDLYGRLIDGRVSIATNIPGAPALGKSGVVPVVAGVIDAAGNDRPGVDGFYSIGPFEQQYTATSLNLNPPVFLYNGEYINFAAGIGAPSFPVQEGLSLHSYVTNKPYYTITNRQHGTSAISWTTNGAQKAHRDTIYDFWDTTLTEGYSDFTVIDHRRRMLFEASWNDWQEKWSKRRGGIFDIIYQIESPIPWTPPTFGIFPMVTAGLINHNLSGNDLTATDGEFVTNATDSSVLRLNGNALKLEGDGSSSGLLGASGSVEWKRTTKHNHITLFCQFMVDATIGTGDLAILETTHSSNVFRLGLKEDTGTNVLFGKIVNNADSTEVRKGAATYHELTNGTWYDLGFTYNAITQKSYLYFAESGDASFTKFLSGETDISEGIGEHGNTDCTVQDIPWTGCNILKELTNDVVANGSNAYVQNAMIFNGVISSHEFNTYRRLSYLWNKKTTTYPK